MPPRSRPSRVPTPSERVSLVHARFGIDDASSHFPPHPAPPLRAAAVALGPLLQPGSIILLSGPSGGGKSSILRLLHAAVGAQLPPRAAPPLLTGTSHAWLRAVAPRGVTRRTPLIDALALPVDDGLSLLARVGLAEAWIPALSLSQLSDGQRFRASIALCLAPALRRQRAGSRSSASPRPVFIDEFTSTLDRLTARALCESLRRAVDSLNHAGRRVPPLVLSTAQEDVFAGLRPDIHVVVPLAPADHRGEPHAHNCGDCGSIQIRPRHGSLGVIR